MKKRYMEYVTKLGFGVAVFIAAFTIKSYAGVVPDGVSISGIELSGKTTEEADKLIQEKINAIKSKTVDIDISSKTIKATVEELGFTCDNEAQAVNLVRSLSTGNVVKRYKAKSDYENSAEKITDLNYKIDETKFDEFMDEKTKGFLDKPVNATIKRENGVFKITDDVEAINIDKEATRKTIESELSSDSNSISIKATASMQKAKITREDLESIKDVLGTYTTDFSSSSEARANNIRVGSAKLGNHLLMPGEELSGYEQMHPFTAANGYQIAHAYENGRVVDSVGGGSCQIATTLYNAALRAEISIPQRQNHSMTVSYVPASCDAAIAGTYKDIKIKNNLDTPIYVEAYTSGKKLTFTIWGKDKRNKGRTIEFVPEVISSTPAGITYKDDPTLPAGKEVKESAGHDGRVSKLWKVVKENGVEVERTLLSTDRYAVSNHIYRRGTGQAVASTDASSEGQGTDQNQETKSGSDTETKSESKSETKSESKSETKAKSTEAPTTAAPDKKEETSGASLVGPGA